MRMAQSILIRRLTEGDLDAVANIHLVAFPGRALAVLGHEAVRRYYEWQLLGPHDAICLGLFKERELVAYCFAGVFRGALSGFLRKNAWFLARRVATHPWLVFSPFMRSRLCLAWAILGGRRTSNSRGSSVPQKSFGILAIAVNPQAQGAGLGKTLMRETESAAIGRGFHRMHLTVAPENLQATAFYERTGWVKVLSADRVWQGLMTKSLAAAA